MVARSSRWLVLLCFLIVGVLLFSTHPATTVAQREEEYASIREAYRAAPPPKAPASLGAITLNVLEIFPNIWHTNTLGMAYNSASDVMLYAHNAQQNNPPTLWHLTAFLPHSTVSNYTLSALNPGFPATLDSRDGVAYDGATSTYFLPDFGGDSSTRFDNVIEITTGGTILNAWELNGAGNDSSDGSAIGSVVDIAIVAGSPNRYFVTNLSGTLREIALTRAGLWVPASWNTVATCALPNGIVGTGIEYDPMTGDLLVASFNSELLTYVDFNCGLQGEPMLCAGPGTFHTGFGLDTSRREVWVTDFISNQTTRCALPNEPEINVTPTVLSEVHPTAPQVTTDTLTIQNAGAGMLTWSIFEDESGLAFVHPPIPERSRPVKPMGDPAQSRSGAASRFMRPRFFPRTDTLQPSFAVGDAHAFRFSIVGQTQFESFVRFPIASPGTITQITSTVGFVGAGDFVAGDPVNLYLVDSNTSQLSRLNVNTGVRTFIANTSIPPTQATGLDWDVSTGRMYVSWSNNCVSSNMAEINLSTGALTNSVVVTNAACLIDIATSPAGQMYGVDIINDSFLAIDKTTGTGTVIGSIGFDANYGQALDFDPTSGVLYYAAFNLTAFNGQWRTVNLATGATTLIAPFDTVNTTQIDAMGISNGSVACDAADDIPWLTVAPTSGGTAGGGSSAITVTYDSTGLLAGTHTGNLCITSNDSDEPLTTIPVTLTVQFGATATPTATNTATPTNTNTPVPPTNTATSTNTNTPVPPTFTATPTNTNTPVPPTNTPTATNTNTPVPPTNTPTATNTNTPVPPTNTPTATNTNTPVPSTNTPTATNTNTPIPPTNTATSTNTNTPVPPTFTATPTNTNTPVPPTNTPTATNTNTPVPPTNTPTVTNTPIPTAPDIEVNPTAFNEVHANAPQVTTDTMTIGNVGLATLKWTIFEDEGSRPWESPNTMVPRDPNAPTQRFGAAGGAVTGPVILGSIVGDGSFETGTPNASWEEFSSNFGTPLCDAVCGTGGGTGPRTGAWWAWFGGTTAAETGIITQTVMIPSGSAELSFWLEIPTTATGTNGFLSVRMDGTELFRAGETTTGYGTYAEVTVDASAYADGGTHELVFFSVTDTGAAVTNFFVDDVAISVTGGDSCTGTDDISWLIVAPAGGVTSGGDSDSVTLTYNSNGLDNGTYTGDICIQSNDPDEFLVTIPVSLTVNIPTAIEVSALGTALPTFNVVDTVATGLLLLAAGALLLRRRT